MSNKNIECTENLHPFLTNKFLVYIDNIPSYLIKSFCVKERCGAFSEDFIELSLWATEENPITNLIKELKNTNTIKIHFLTDKGTVCDEMIFQVKYRSCHINTDWDNKTPLSIFPIFYIMNKKQEK